MEAFSVHAGLAAPMPQPNIDTDEIIPARHLKTIAKTGLGFAAFEKQRYLDTECKQENPNFVLNKPKYRGASVLVAGENFGCGSSREHAPWSLLDAGVRCVIAPSFADIFYNNSFKNGLLPVAVPDKSSFAKLMSDAEQGSKLTVDLTKSVVRRPNGEEIAFKVDDVRREMMLNGLDDIGVTLSRSENNIKAYEAKRRAEFPWLG